MAELSCLSMPSARFAVEFSPTEGEPGFDRYGSDGVRFLMSANAGEAPGRISRIASGGELEPHHAGHEERVCGERRRGHAGI